MSNERKTSCLPITEEDKATYEEVIGIDAINAKIKNGDTISCYWGTAPTGQPHFAYLLPMIKLKELMDKGWCMTVLIADVHALMDKGKEDAHLIEARSHYYMSIITRMLEVVGVKEMPEFRFGSEFQYDKKYNIDLMSFSSLINVNDAVRAVSSVIKTTSNPPLSTYFYPLMQVLDEQALNVDVQLGGIDQRKIFMLSVDWSDKLKKEKCAYLMTPLIPSLTYGKTYEKELKKIKASNPTKTQEQVEKLAKEKTYSFMKMSASAEESCKIEFSDDNDRIYRKIKSAYCIDGQTDMNALLMILKHIVFPIKGAFHVHKEDGTDCEYSSYEQLLEDWITLKLKSKELKHNLTYYIIDIIGPIRNWIEENDHMREAAYPSPEMRSVTREEVDSSTVFDDEICMEQSKSKNKSDKVRLVKK